MRAGDLGESSFVCSNKCLLQDKNTYFPDGESCTVQGSLESNQLHFFEQQFSKVFWVYRFASLGLTSTFYAFRLHGNLSFRHAALLLLLLASSLLVVFLYKRFSKNVRAVGAIIVLESVGLGLLLFLTGGLNSPFTWYALNPIILSSVYLPVLFTALLLFYFSLVIAAKFFLLHQGLTVAEILESFFFNESGIVLTILLLALVFKLFSRLFITLMDQSGRLEQQQQELFCAYQGLSENHWALQALSQFQRDAVSCKSEEALYRTFIAATESVFPFSPAAVVILEQPEHDLSYVAPGRFKVFTSAAEHDQTRIPGHVLDDLGKRWTDLSLFEVVVGRKQEWIALPFWNNNNKFMSAYIAMQKPGMKTCSIPEALNLYIKFAIQILESLEHFKQAEKTVDFISSLYEAVETISSRDDPKEIIDLFAAYAKSLTGCEKVIFWLERLNAPSLGDDDQSGTLYTVRGQLEHFPEECWYPVLLQAWTEMREKPETKIETIEDPVTRTQGYLICVPVESRSECLGLLAALQPKKHSRTEEIIQTLSLLAGLSSVAIERNMAELFTDRLLLLEEQNRIANEIHDSVSQNLFSIVYGVEALLRQSSSLSGEYQVSLATIRDVAAVTSKELRLLIYRLSPRHRKDETFVQEMKSFLEGLGKLNSIEIDFQVEGQEEYLNPAMQKAFYRILKEATGNAVRHGECTRIRVTLQMSPFFSELVVSDNGKGFDPDAVNRKAKGFGSLGMVNMRELTYSLRGTFEVQSSQGQGTTLRSMVPTSPVSSGQVPAG